VKATDAYMATRKPGIVRGGRRWVRAVMTGYGWSRWVAEISCLQAARAGRS